MKIDEEGLATTSDSYLNKIFLHQPNYLVQFQQYWLSNLFCKPGKPESNGASFILMCIVWVNLSADITLTEPIIRNANMISFDMGAIRSSDAAANANASPNGFYGEEACRIAVMRE